jgi:transposase-like protein
LYGKNVSKGDLQMSKAMRYTEEFKQEAVAQVIERGY